MTDRKITDELRAVEAEMLSFASKWKTIENKLHRERLKWDTTRQAYINGLDDELRAKARAIGILELAE